MKNTILLLLLLLTSSSILHSQSVKDYRQTPRFHTYIQGALSYTQFMYKVQGAGGEFDNYWRSQLGGNLAYGWRKNSAFGPRLTFAGQVGLLLHRTKPMYYMESFSELGWFASIGLETDERKWKIAILPWLAYFPNMEYRGRYSLWQDKMYDQWWVGISLGLSRPISSRIDLSSGIYYGRHISDVPFYGVGGGLYGHTRDMPFWINLGLRYHAWGRY